MFKINQFSFLKSDLSQRPDFLLFNESLLKDDSEYENLIEDIFLESLSLREGFLRNLKINHVSSESAAMSWAGSNFENNQNLVDFLNRNKLSWADVVVHFNKRLMYQEVMELYIGVNDFEIQKWCEQNEEVLNFMWSEWRKGTKLPSAEEIPKNYAYQYCRSALLQHKSSNPTYKEKAIEAISRGLNIEWPNR